MSLVRAFRGREFVLGWVCVVLFINVSRVLIFFNRNNYFLGLWRSVYFVMRFLF